MFRRFNSSVATWAAIALAICCSIAACGGGGSSGGGAGSTSVSSTSAQTPAQTPAPATAQPINVAAISVSLPTVPGNGAPSVSGSLIFGIGTQGNNGLAGAQVIGVDPSRGVFTTTQNGTTYGGSIIDSGSTGLFFSTNQMSACASPDQAYYCPSATEQFSAVNTGANGTTSAVTFSVGNAAQIWQASGGGAAMPLFAGPAFVGSQVFDWGLPFFYGRNVYAAVEQAPTPGGTGPYFAY